MALSAQMRMTMALGIKHRRLNITDELASKGSSHTVKFAICCLTELLAKVSSSCVFSFADRLVGRSLCEDDIMTRHRFLAPLATPDLRDRDIGSKASPYKTYDLGPFHQIESLVVNRGELVVRRLGHMLGLRTQNLKRLLEVNLQVLTSLPCCCRRPSCFSRRLEQQQ